MLNLSTNEYGLIFDDSKSLISEFNNIVSKILEKNDLWLYQSLMNWKKNIRINMRMLYDYIYF